MTNDLFIKNLDTEYQEPEPLINALLLRLKLYAIVNDDAKAIVHVLTDLINLDDELITSILENAAIDELFHNLKGEIIEAELKKNGNVKYGEFCPMSRTVRVAISPITLTTFIHELSHACVFFTFRPTKIFQPASVPHAYTQGRHAKFNPAELKFKKCVNDDDKHLQNNPQLCDYLFSPRDDLRQYSQDFKIRVLLLKMSLKNFFNNIRDSYHKVDLAEIFPFYMELRTSLLKLAKDYQIDKALVNATLQRCLPRLHDYFETDMKRILKHRLIFFTNYYCLDISSKLPEPKGVAYKCDKRHVLRGFWYERQLRVEAERKKETEATALSVRLRLP